MIPAGMFFKRLIVILIFTCPFLVNAKWYKHTFNVMGTQSSIEFWLDPQENSDDLADHIIALLVTDLNRIDEKMSPYKPASELSRVNQKAAFKPVVISVELFNLIEKAQAISQLSDGSFDITYASVGYHYNYRDHIKPSQAIIDESTAIIDYTSLALNRTTLEIYFQQPKIKIDLGGIAKGYAIKQCINILKNKGIEHALVSAGGDTALLGDRRGRDWLVGIKHPRAHHKTAVHIPLTNEVISTSGDYERYFIEKGIRYHHIIHPDTGKSAKGVVSVSIIGQDATYVDALSTTIFVKGLAKGMDFINGLDGYEAIIIDNEQKLHFSKGLQQ